MRVPNILLVDDVEFFLEMEKDLLSNTPAAIHTARNGREALDIVRQKRPDIIFMDVTMPVMDGITCCRALKADPDLNSIPVIMVFAPSREVGPETVLAAGCNGYLTKPVDRKAFLETGRRFLFDIERRDTRIPCQVAVVLKRNLEELLCASEDISIHGMYVRSRVSVTVDDVLQLSFALPGESLKIDCRARVSWINQGFPRIKLDMQSGFGVEFLQLSQTASATIRSFIERRPAHKPAITGYSTISASGS